MFYTRKIPISFEQIVSIYTQIQTNSKTGSKFGNHGERSKHGEHVKDGKHQPDDLEHSIYDSKHFIRQPHDSKHSILQHLL